MKKNLLLFSTAVLSLFTSFGAMAQMSGTYTINASGSGARNFTTFTKAVDTLVKDGVNGMVTFNISNGTYNEQLIIPAITGASLTNTITFQSASGDSSAVILTDTSSSTAGAGNCTVCMEGGAYITFHQLTIQRTGTKTDAVVLNHHAGSSSHNISYTNNRIICGSTTSLTVYGMRANDTVCVFSHNYIQGGSDGIEWFNIGAKGFVFEYNTVTGFASGGVVFEDLASPLVLGNIISQPLNSGTTGIYMDGGNTGSLVEKNIIYLDKEGTGINETVDSATSASPNTIANNFITIGDTLLSSNTGGTGIHGNNNQYENIYFNSINMVDKKSSTTSLGFNFMCQVSHSCNVNVENNIVSATGGGVPFTLDGSDASYYLATCNYNDYYTRGGVIGVYATNGKTTLAAWQSAIGKDASSKNFNPLYITDTSYLYTYNPALNAGTPVSGITTDINGTTRNATTPDIGAYEFSPTAVTGSTSVCAGSTVSYTSPLHSGSSYAWTVTGGTISSGGSTYSANIVWGSAGSGTLKVVETNGLYKDSAIVTVTINGLPSANAGSASAICSGGTASVGASPVSGDTYSWTSNPSGFSSTLSNPSFSPTATTTYTLTETITSTGCSKSNPVVITVNPLPAANAGSNQMIVIGNTITIGASSTSGHTYSWVSNPYGFTSTLSNPKVRPLVTTTYSLTETITATGCSNSNSVSVFILPLSSTLTQDTAYIRMVFDSVPYIFEGTVSSQKCYTNEAGNYIYTANNIQVSKVFRGNDSLTCGDSVDLITEGGQVGDQTLWISHNLELSTGVTGIFFCIPSHYPSTNRSVVNMRSYFTNDGVIQEFNDGVNLPAVGVYMMFPSLDSLYSFLLAQPNMVWNDCGGDIDVLTRKKPFSPVKNSLSISDKNREASKLEIVTGKIKSQILRIQNSPLMERKTPETLNIDFANPKTTGTYPPYFEFDINVSSNNSSSYLDFFAAYFKYDTLIFGSNISANNRIIVTRGSAFSNTSYIDTPFSFDFGSDTLGIAFYTQPSPTSRIAVTTTPTRLMHCKIQIDSCFQYTGLSFFYNGIIDSINDYADNPGDTTTYPYDVVNYGSDLNVKGCTATINSISPTSVDAGTNEQSDTLIITGNGFGTRGSKSSISMADADDGGKTYLQINNSNIYKWQDNEIDLIVPSYVDSIDFHNDITATPGSGLMTIENYWGNTADDSLKIYYGIENKIIPLSYDIGRISLAKVNTKPNYIFMLNDTVWNNDSAKNCIASAIRHWNCATTVNFKMGRDTTLDTARQDSVCLIIYNGFDQPTGNDILMQTSLWTNHCLNVLYPTDIDIRIRKKPIPTGTIWTYDTTGSRDIHNNQYDFYHAILHELGHAHCLTHVNNKSALMYYASAAKYTPASQRSITIQGEALDGGTDVINYSESRSFSLCTNVSDMQPLISNICAATNGINETKSENFFYEIYPNPTNGNVNIKLNSNERLLNLKAIDCMGKVVFCKNIQQISTMGNYTNIDLGNLVSGMYILTITTEEGTSAQKLIVNHN